MSTQIAEPNCWTAAQAAKWAGVGYRLMLDLFAEGLLPAIAISPDANASKRPRGKRRKRRAARWLVPREAFMQAWRTLPRTVTAKRGRAA
jgi:hypothetical protein